MLERNYSLVPYEDIDAVVIGAGVVGLAVARNLARNGREVFVFEAESNIGEHTSSRNSEVIHSGIYYKKDSLKARLCVEGKEKLYGYCEEKDISHKRLGKMVVATRDEEISKLQEIQERAVVNGVHDLEWLDATDIQRMEPAVRGVSGLLSPSTGIIDSHGLMKSLKRDAEEQGGSVILSTPVFGGEVQDSGIILSLGGRDASIVRAKTVVNCAGLSAPKVAKGISGLSPDSVPESFYTKGHYFTMSKLPPFSHLVYPIPEEGGLGIHVTLDLDGRARFGPDVSPLDEIDYSFDETRAERFYTAIRTYYPQLADGDLHPGQTGIRPKLRGSSEQDFVIQGPTDHDVPGLVNLFGIESPGLTASLAIAEYVKGLL